VSRSTVSAHPALLAAFARGESLDEALAYTRRLACGHYENFSVVSLLLPRHLRQDFCNIYAFCRTVDDLGDEVGDPEVSLASLAQMREQTLACHAGRAETLVFIALRETINRHQIPAQPFLDLIDAFEQDQRVNRYATFADLLNYCRRSANPVGRLVLYICGYRDADRQELSDKTCTALQLANFWQDVRRDYLNVNRIYIPQESMARFGVTEAQLSAQVHQGRCTPEFRDLLRFEIERTETLFDEGDQLLPLLNAAVRPQVRLFGQGGRAILKAIRRRGFDTISRRPKLSALQKSALVAKGCAGRLSSVLHKGEAA
jgi:squalene synthase HpnC